MHFKNQLEDLRQKLCDEINETPHGNERGRAKDQVITAIDNLMKALEKLDE